MKIRLLLISLLLLAVPLAVTAQDETPDAVPTLSALQAEVNAALARAAEMVEDVEQRVDYAFDLLGLYEVIGVIVGFFVALGGAAFGYSLRQITRAQRQTQALQMKMTRQLQNIEASEKSIDSLRQSIEAKDEALRQLSQQLEERALAQRQEITQALMAQSLLNLGARQYQGGDFKGAIETYSRALELDQHNPITHYQLGYVYVHNDRLKEAEHHLTRALEIDPRLAQALATLGYTYRRMGTDDETLDDIERLRYLNLAEQKLLEALAISSRMIDDDGESWWGSLGGLYRRTNRNDEAIIAYKRAAQVTPHSSYPFSNLAMLYMTTHNHQAMLEAFERVEDLAYTETLSDKNNYWAFNDLVTSRLALNKVNEARSALASLFYTAPKDSNYALESLLDTLRRLLDALGGPGRAPHIPPIIDELEREIADRAQAHASNGQGGGEAGADEDNNRPHPDSDETDAKG